MSKAQAILLVGPTGAGKTPLGDLLAERGLWGRPCRHFDFGHRLRRTVAAGAGPGLTADDVEFLRSVLRSGALLENEHFHVARKILQAFLDETPLARDELVVLNGLPRHVGQADDVDELVDVPVVVELACTPRAVFERIRTDPGGDRAGRADDDLPAVRNKLALYAGRTAPLLDHYRRRGAAVETVDVGAATTADDVRDALLRRPRPGRTRTEPC